MKKIKRIIFYLIIFVALLSAGTYWYIKSTLPDYSGQYQVSGIKGKIEIIRDKSAIPHIYADHQDDLAFGMGYVMAEDRLWQMDLFKRVAIGRLSEIFGEQTLAADRFAKVLGFQRNALLLLDSLTLDEKEYLQAFVNGINKYIESHPGNIPMEFKILQYDAEKFSPLDIISLSYFQSYASNHNWKYELLRAAAIKELGEKKGRELVSAITFHGPYMAQPGEHDENEGRPAVKDFSQKPAVEPDNMADLSKVAERKLSNPLFAAMLEVDDQIKSIVGVQSNQVHSNYWVISGERSQSGKPVFANDYHMPFLLPSLWYEIHIVGDGIDAMGISMPGSPTIIAGHNKNIAWGATTTGADTQDMFWEKLNPDNPSEYMFNGEYIPFKTYTESIKYKKDGEILTDNITVKESRHGPVINSIVESLSGSDSLMALQGVENAAKGQMSFSMKIYKAKNWQEFKKALAEIRAPVWNWGYADQNGNIGYKLTGKIPVRKKGYGLEPHIGWTGEFEWMGYIPFEDLPEVYNPQSGYIISANNEILDSRYPHLIFGSTFQLPFRAMRIESLILKKDKLSQEDIRKIQADTHSEFALILGNYVKKTLDNTKNEDDRLKDIKEYIEAWDGATDVDNVANTIVQEFFVQLINKVYANKISDRLFKQFIKSGRLNYVASTLLLKLNDPAFEHWFDNPATQITETKEQTIEASLLAAYDSLKKYFGSDIKQWKWGEIHKTHFKHQMGKVTPFSWFCNIGPNKYGGDFSTVNPGTYQEIDQKPYPAVHGASMRHIVDFGYLENSDLVITTGQSGRRISPFYDDQAKLWHELGYLTIPTGKTKLESGSIGITILSPQD
ncbi:MAG: penicillin acylase family protein [Bacteroidota bacterium]